MIRCIRRNLLRLALLFALTAVLALPAYAQDGPVRRVHAPYFADEVPWAEAGIFWFGEVDLPGIIPGRNSVDVRVAYTADELIIYPNIQDYYLWYPLPATSSTDLTQYDAVAVYLDTAHDGADNPQPDDYLFLAGLCLYNCGDGTAYMREARGDGSGWDFAWHADWTKGTWAQWVGNPPHNNNENTFDYGWWAFLHLPWSALGLSGPPAEGTVWGLGVVLYDRDDQPPAGYAAPEFWPETFQADHPATWGELAFGLANYTPPSAVVQGTTVIRRGLGESIVEDSWVGGGGNCTGGHEGDPDQDNYGGDGSLFVENQSWIADFPCFSKSFLRFYLDPIPPGKVIISATLTIHHWSNARWEEAKPSLIWLFTTDGDWGEYTLTWNNAPLARENLTATWVDVITPENNPGLPGVPYDWDATQAVAEAYAAGEPLNIALYTADVNQHSSKYLISSDSAPAYAEGRPTLTVVWGTPAAQLYKQVQPVTLTTGQVMTYTLSLLGSGQALTLTDPLPVGVSAPGRIQATAGEASYDSLAHQITWHGTPTTGQAVTITFPVTVTVTVPTTLSNTAVLSYSGGTSTATAIAIANPWQVYLPLVKKDAINSETKWRVFLHHPFPAPFSPPSGWYLR